MPYIVVKSNGQEVARRELDTGIVIGRAPDCDVAVRDILLSRRHVRLQPSDDGWMVQDLQSKNGSVLNGEKLDAPRVLRDNDVVRFGRSKIVFHAGLPDEDFADQVLAPARPATPGDSLAGTLSGFTLLLPGEGEMPQDMPNPKPRAKDPPAYDKEELQTLLSAIASSSWDSVYAEARQPLRGGQGIEMDDEVKERRRRARPSSPTDFSLQASLAAAAPAAAATVIPVVKPKRRPVSPALHVAVAAVWVCLLVLLNLSHKPIEGAEAARTPVTPPADVLHLDDADMNVNADVGGGAAQIPSVSEAPAKPMQFNARAAEHAAGVSAFYLAWIW